MSLLAVSTWKLLGHALGAVVPSLTIDTGKEGGPNVLVEYIGFPNAIFLPVASLIIS